MQFSKVIIYDLAKKDSFEAQNQYLQALVDEIYCLYKTSYQLPLVVIA